MSLQIQIGTISEDPRCLTKSPTLGNSISCDVYEGCSVLNPRLILEYNSSYTACNYLKIDAWNRYYFIDGIDLVPGGKAIIRAHCDVLYTYSSSIKNLEANIVRQENQYKSYLPDNNFVFQNKFDKITKLFSIQPFNAALSASTDSYVLAIAGNENPYAGGLWNVDGYTIVSVEPADWSSNWRNYYVNQSSQAPYDVVMTSVGSLYQFSQPSFDSVKARYHTVYQQN